METQSLEIIGKFFRLRLNFILSNDGYVLRDVVKDRLLNPLVNKYPLKILSDQKTIILENTSENELLKYLKDNQIGEYTYIEINFDSLRILNSKKEYLFKFNILKYLQDKNIQLHIKTNLLDKKSIVSTLTTEPLIPFDKEEIILNNLFLEAILKQFDKQISTIKISNNVILSGEMIWGCWIGDIGIINILKKILGVKNYNVYFDNNGIWKALLEKRKENDFLYKISRKIFIPDILFINSLLIKEGKRFTLEDSSKEMILLKDKFVNVILNRNYQKNLPKVLIVNNRDQKSILECNKNDLFPNFSNKSKSLIDIGLVNKVSYMTDERAKANFGIKIESLIKNRQKIEKGDAIGYIQRNSTNVQIIDSKNFISESIQKQLIQKGDVIGYKRKIFGRKVIKANHSGKVMFDLVKYGLILIEDKHPNQTLLSPWSGTCLSHSNIDGHKLLIDFIKIPLRYQMGNNVVAFKETFQKIDYNKLILSSDLSLKDLSIMEIIENNIRLVIIEQYDRDLFNKFIQKYPYILDYVSFAFINDVNDNRDLRIQSILNGNFVKSIILDNGYLKIYCDSSTKEFISLKSQYATIENNIVKRISYKQDIKYGIIIKSQNSTEKVIKYDTEAVIEPNSNLINLRYKL